MKTKNIIYIALITTLILLIPLIAMQFTNEVNWTIFDFIIAGILLFSTGLAYGFATQNIKNTKYKVIIGIVIAAVLIFIWIQLAVGIWGD